MEGVNCYTLESYKKYHAQPSTMAYPHMNKGGVKYECNMLHFRRPHIRYMKMTIRQLVGIWSRVWSNPCGVDH
jgi:hypothetical protein